MHPDLRLPPVRKPDQETAGRLKTEHLRNADGPSGGGQPPILPIPREAPTIERPFFWRGRMILGAASAPKPVTVPAILQRKGQTPRLTVLTAYDFLFAQLLDRAGVDMILVGDSLGTVLQGHPTTLPVTLDQMVYHAQCVTRAVHRALVIGDLPFLSYQSSPEQAIMSAGRLLKEAGVSAVKLEGGVAMAETVRRLTSVDIPVMGHVGLTPQSVHRMGGHKIQGRLKANARGPRSAGSREQILEDAKALDQAGAFALVLEGIPIELAREITATVSIPTIGIGAGPECDGQVLVTHDLLGMAPRFQPTFVKRYAEIGQAMELAVKSYIQEVQEGVFPDPSHSFSERD